jgi:hypothetical protein
MFTFQKKYFLIALLLFFIELFIAFFVADTIIRPFIGDLLVVVMMYCFLKSFIRIAALPTALSVLAFSYVVEILQYFKLIYLLGWEQSLLAHLIIGSSFHWIDMLMYTAGIVLTMYAESISRPRIAARIKEG